MTIMTTKREQHLAYRREWYRKHAKEERAKRREWRKRPENRAKERARLERWKELHGSPGRTFNPVEPLEPLPPDVKCNPYADWYVAYSDEVVR